MVISKTYFRMKSIKLAIIALLGFSTACSTVKEGSKSKKEKEDKVEVTPSIVVMYGVRRPVAAPTEIRKVETPSAEQTPATTDPKPTSEAK